jgi:LPXTG-motif cell wall-anchored protein
MTTKRSISKQTVAGVTLAAIGGLMALTGLVSPAGADPVYDETQYDAHLKDVHHGSTNPGFQEGECPEGPEGATFGWHFVFQGVDTEFVSVSATFENAGEVTDFVSFPSGKHAYVYTTGADTLLDAVAMTNGGEDVEFNLSHICVGEETTTDDGTTDDTTTDEGTTDEVLGTDSVNVTDGEPEVKPTEVKGVQTLPVTGPSSTGILALVGAAMVIGGGALVHGGRKGNATS